MVDDQQQIGPKFQPISELQKIPNRWSKMLFLEDAKIVGL